MYIDNLSVQAVAAAATSKRSEAEIVMPPPPPGLPNPHDGRVLPSIFSVLPQQLGLRLRAERGPVEILVVDGADHPTEN